MGSMDSGDKSHWRQAPQCLIGGNARKLKRRSGSGSGRLHAILARPLGLVHGLIGTLDQIVA